MTHSIRILAAALVLALSCSVEDAGYDEDGFDVLSGSPEEESGYSLASFNGKTIYVSPAGTGSGADASHPTDIYNALKRLVADGDIVVLMNGIYE